MVYTTQGLPFPGVNQVSAELYSVHWKARTQAVNLTVVAGERVWKYSDNLRRNGGMSSSQNDAQFWAEFNQ
jgi:hypothetical protein